MRIILIIASVFALSFASAFSLKENLTKGQPGDYVVTQQGNIYSVLLIRSISASIVQLEEISVPDSEVSSDIIWKEWVEAKAPGHTSWCVFEIELNEAKMLESYSYSRAAWLYYGDSDHFLTKLLSLPFKTTPDTKRRRIGPAPSIEETDHRSFWTPPVIVEGIKMQKPKLSSCSANWPKDDTRLSGCEVELYFGDFPFPYWIDVKSTHFTASIRAVDSGSHLTSPMPPMPQRPPEFLGQAQLENRKIMLTLKCPAYYHSLNLYAIDLSQDTKPTIAIPSTFKRGSPNQVFLEISEKTLQKLFQTGHRYQWIAVPENSPHVLAESNYIFVW